MLHAARSAYHYLCYQMHAVRISTYVNKYKQLISLLMLHAARSTYHYLCYQMHAERITTYVTSCTQLISLLMLPAAGSRYHYLRYPLHAVGITTYVTRCTQWISLIMLPAARSTYHYICPPCTQYVPLYMFPDARSTYHYLCYQLHAVNLYRTGLSFSVRVHGTEFPFKSLRVFDSKRLYLVNRRRWNNEIIEIFLNKSEIFQFKTIK